MRMMTSRTGKSVRTQQRFVQEEIFNQVGGPDL